MAASLAVHVFAMSGAMVWIAARPGVPAGDSQVEISVRDSHPSEVLKPAGRSVAVTTRMRRHKVTAPVAPVTVAVDGTIPPLEAARPVKAPSNFETGLVDYRAELRHEIELHKEYPRSARQRRQEGTVEVRFTVAHDGTFENIRLHKESSFLALNQAALNAVTTVKKFRPLPGDEDGGGPRDAQNALDLVVALVFVLN